MRIPSFLRSQRLWGLTGTAVALYLLIFVVLGKVDIGWMLPTRRIAEAIIHVWPRLPFFSTEREVNADGTVEIRYTVPTRQFTKQELDRMQGTNRTAKPTEPEKK